MSERKSEKHIVVSEQAWKSLHFLRLLWGAKRVGDVVDRILQYPEIKEEVVKAQKMFERGLLKDES